MEKDSGLDTILIVDDVPENIDILTGILSSDYEITVALDGEETLGILQHSKPPDLILLDVLMPGIDGFEVCRLLKENELLRDIPVIFVTAMDEVADEARGFAVGGVDYITKPLSPSIVLARVKAQLELKRARENLKKQNEILKENLILREDMESIIRHDLKSPLSVVMWVPDVLRLDGNLTEHQHNTLDILQQAGNSMLRIINSSINMIKIERGEYRMKPQLVDLVALCKQVLNEFMGLMKNKNLTFKKYINGRLMEEADHFYLEGEDILLYSMLANLIKNAIEASPKNSEITFSLTADECRVIRIHNYGEIDEEICANMFKKFISSNKKHGSGLGTYSAKLIAEIHQGRISFDADKIFGNTVTISFPNKTEAD